MSKLEGKKLTHATLHQPIHHPDCGQLGPVLQSTADAQRPAVSMTISEPWVLVEVPNKKDRKKVVRVIVPMSGFTHMVLED